MRATFYDKKEKPRYRRFFLFGLYISMRACNRFDNFVRSEIE